jgi:hypothetical protein
MRRVGTFVVAWMTLGALAQAQPQPAAPPATDTATDTDTDTDTVPAPDPGPALGLAAGASLQTDALYFGPRLEYRGLFIPYLDATFTLLAGTAEDYLLLRTSFHLRPIVRIDATRLYLILGAGIHHGRPIGELGDFCQRLENGCTVTAVAFELGLGFAWRALGLDLYLATGDVPRLTGLLHATLEL